MNVVSGPCVDTEHNGLHCVTTSGFPNYYSSGERCEVSLQKCSMLHVSDFHTEHDDPTISTVQGDAVYIGGQSYSGMSGPFSVLPSSSKLTWSSDSDSSRGRGWRICQDRLLGSTINTTTTDCTTIGNSPSSPHSRPKITSNGREVWIRQCNCVITASIPSADGNRYTVLRGSVSGDSITLGGSSGTIQDGVITWDDGITWSEPTTTVIASTATTAISSATTSATTTAASASTTMLRGTSPSITTQTATTTMKKDALENTAAPSAATTMVNKASAVSVVSVVALIDVDLSQFGDAVGVEDLVSVDLGALPAQKQTSVKSFAQDMAASFKVSFANELTNVDAAAVTVTCMYRVVDAAKLDLLTLTASCGDGRRLQAFSDNSATSVLGFQLEITAGSPGEVGMFASLAESATSASVDLQSSGVTATATIAAISIPMTTTPGALSSDAASLRIAKFPALAGFLIVLIWGVLERVNVGMHVPDKVSRSALG